MKKDNEGFEILTKDEVGTCPFLFEKNYNGKLRAWCEKEGGAWCTATAGSDNCGMKQQFDKS